MAGGMILASWLAVSHALVLPQPIGHQIAMRPGRAFAAVMREPSTEPAESQGAFQGIVSRLKGSVVPVMNGAAAEGEADKQSKEGEGMTLEKVASFGIAGVLSIAVAEFLPAIDVNLKCLTILRDFQHRQRRVVCVIRMNTGNNH